MGHRTQPRPRRRRDHHHDHRPCRIDVVMEQLETLQPHPSRNLHAPTRNPLNRATQPSSTARYMAASSFQKNGNANAAKPAATNDTLPRS